MKKTEYKMLKKLIDFECNRCILKPEYKEPIILVHRNLKKMLRDFFKQIKLELEEIEEKDIFKIIDAWVKPLIVAGGEYSFRTVGIHEEDIARLKKKISLLLKKRKAK